VHPNEEHNAISRCLNAELESSQNIDIDGRADAGEDAERNLDNEANSRAHARDADLKISKDGNTKLNDSSHQDVCLDAHFEDELEADEEINEDVGAGSCEEDNVDVDAKETGDTDIRLHSKYSRNEKIKLDGELSKQCCENREGNTTGRVACISDGGESNVNISLKADNVRD